MKTITKLYEAQLYESDIQKLQNESKFVVEHFIKNKLSSTVFKYDSNQAKKLKGIEQAIKEGYLFVRNIPLSKDIKVLSTIKLLEYYYK